MNETGIERVQALADISLSALCCHSNETRSPIANPGNSAHSYIQVRAVVWEFGEGQTDTHGRDHYTFRLTRNVMNCSTTGSL